MNTRILRGTCVISPPSIFCTNLGFTYINRNFIRNFFFYRKLLFYSQADRCLNFLCIYTHLLPQILFSCVSSENSLLFFCDSKWELYKKRGCSRHTTHSLVECKEITLGFVHFFVCFVNCWSQFFGSLFSIGEHDLQEQPREIVIKGICAT